MSLTRKLYPKAEIYDALSYREQKRVNSLVMGNLICFVMFLVFTIVLFSMKFTMMTALLMAVACILFLVSIILIKNGKIYIGSYFSTIALIYACFVATFFTTKAETSFLNYRTGCFCAVMAIINFMISLKRSQLILFHVLSQVLLYLSTFTLYLSYVKQDMISWVSSVLINSLGLLAGNLILYSSTKQNDLVVFHAENEHEKASKSLKTITDVLSHINESMNVAQQLNVAADDAAGSVNQINILYKTLLSEIEDLRNQANSIKDSSEEVNYQAGMMREGMQEQNESLSETSSAITQISSNLSNVNEIAEKRREGMDAVSKILDGQAALIKKLVNEVERVKSSSKGIAAFVKTVDSIAGQTSLLAMNASIEAAHAGVAGKGFSVIAQEIRKLSEETTQNASKIGDTLKENTEVVQKTTKTVNEFARSTEESSYEIRETIDSMEEILRGIGEMNIATRDVMVSLHKIVEKANDNTSMIDAVVENISAQDDSLVNMSNTTDNVQEKVYSLNNVLSVINGAIDKVHSTAQENDDVSKEISTILH